MGAERKSKDAIEAELDAEIQRAETRRITAENGVVESGWDHYIEGLHKARAIYANLDLGCQVNGAFRREVKPLYDGPLREGPVRYAVGCTYGVLDIRRTVDAGKENFPRLNMFGEQTRAVRVNGVWMVPVRDKVEHDFYEHQFAKTQKSATLPAGLGPVSFGQEQPIAPVKMEGDDIFGLHKPA